MTRSLFSLEGNACRPIASWLPSLERDLQRFMERHLSTLLGVTFLASEWALQGGQADLRIDTIGIDADGFPVIIEYKKLGADNILNQVLFYLSNLQQHKGDFTELVRRRLGESHAQNIDWKGARALCVAHEFNPYDMNAVDQTRANVDLVAFEFFSNNTFELDVVKTHRVYRKPEAPVAPMGHSRLTFTQLATFASDNVQRLVDSLMTSLNQADDSLLYTDTREGLILTTTVTDIGRIYLSGGAHPRLKVSMNAQPDPEQALVFPGIKVGQEGSQFSIRTHDQLNHLLSWITDQASRSLF